MAQVNTAYGGRVVDMDYLANLQFDMRFVNGQRIRVSANEIIELLYHRYMIAFYLATILMIIALRPHDQALILSGTRFILVYFGIYFFSFFNFAIFLIAGAWVLQSFGRSTISITVTQFSATLVNTWLGSIAIAAAGGAEISNMEMLLQWLMNSVIFELALTGFGLAFGPSMLRDLRTGDQATGDSKTANLMEYSFQAQNPTEAPDGLSHRWVPELEIQPIEIVRAEAQQNYVLIFTANRRKMVRLPFQRFVSLIPEGLGVRIHRSHWVARSQIADFVAQDGKIFVLLKDGTQLPISKQYRIDILPNT